MLFHGVDDRIRVDVHQPGRREGQRSHESLSSRKCRSYSSQVGKQRGLGPGGSVPRNSNIDMRRGFGCSGTTTMTSNEAPSGNGEFGTTTPFLTQPGTVIDMTGPA